MHISLNLATRPYIDLRPALKRLRIGIAVLTGLGLILCLGLHAFHQKAEEARATELQVQRQIDSISRERQGYQAMMNQPENAQLLAQIDTLNKLFDEKIFSWTLAIEDLETVLPAGVEVTNLEPIRDAKTGQITLKLRVVGPRDHADDLVQNLEHSRYFLQPHIVGESSETSGGPNEKLEPVSASNRFNYELLAEYNSSASADRKAERKLEDGKPPADGERIGQRAPQHHAIHPPATGQQGVRTPYTGPAQNRPLPPLRKSTSQGKPHPGGAL
jgi:type IV pilus assembly protein PilN